jgi:hypothetical protein
VPPAGDLKLNASTLEQARAAKAHAEAVFTPLARVAGIGITRIDGGYDVKVNLREPPAPDVTLPQAVDGVPVRIEVVGAIRKA